MSKNKYKKRKNAQNVNKTQNIQKTTQSNKPQQKEQSRDITKKSASQKKQGFFNKESIPMYVGITIFILFTINNALLFGNENIQIIRWMLALLIVGFAFFPITSIWFKNFNDKGFLQAQIFGIGISSVVFYWFSNLKLLKFTTFNCIIVTIWTLIAFYLFLILKNRKNKKPIFLLDFTQKNINYIVIEEVAFFAILSILLYFKTFNPSAYGIEKFMDYGFMQAMSKTDYFPMEDLWFSGTNLNYYYFGQYIATFITKISSTEIVYTYNIMHMSIPAFLSIGTFSIVNTLITSFNKDKKGKFKEFSAIFFGSLAGLASTFIGNGHYLMYKWVFPFLHKNFNISLGHYTQDFRFWFPDSTRFIGHFPNTNDKTTHEFPSYATVLGDLHAHVINSIFVITFVAFVVAYVINKFEDKQELYTTDKNIPFIKRFLYKDIVKELFSPIVFCIGLFLAIFQATNYWDFPIYFVVAGCLVLLTNYKRFSFGWLSTILTITQGIISVLLSELIILPFIMNFDKMESGVHLVDRHSPLWQLAILWAIPIVCCIIGFFIIFKEYAKSSKNIKNSFWCKLFSSINVYDAIAFAIGCCAIGLVLTPEFVYVKDIYGDVYQRNNTMFKTTYQAFILFGVAQGYFIFRMFHSSLKTKALKILGCLFVFLIFALNGYFGHSVKAWFNGVTDYEEKSYKTLAADAFLSQKTQFTGDKEMIDYINYNIEGRPIILEQYGTSYSDYCRLSVFTGNPTVMGWHTHEWLWKDNFEIVDEREKDVRTIYQSINKEEILDLLQKYDVDYIYYGNLEYDQRTQYYQENVKIMLELCSVEYSLYNPKMPSNPIYLLKVNKELFEQ